MFLDQIKICKDPLTLPPLFSPSPGRAPALSRDSRSQASFISRDGTDKDFCQWNLKLMPFLVFVSGPRILWPPLLGPCRPPAPRLNPGCLFLCPLITSAGPRVLPEHREVKQLVLRHNAALAKKCFRVNIKEEDCIVFSCY